MMITHEEAMTSVTTLRRYCDERFSHDLGERGCKECIFSIGARRKRCALTKYFNMTPNLAEPAVKEKYKELTNAEP